MCPACVRAAPAGPLVQRPESAKFPRCTGTSTDPFLPAWWATADPPGLSSCPAVPCPPFPLFILCTPVLKGGTEGSARPALGTRASALGVDLWPLLADCWSHSPRTNPPPAHIQDTHINQAPAFVGIGGDAVETSSGLHSDTAVAGTWPLSLALGRDAEAEKERNFTVEHKLEPQ